MDDLKNNAKKDLDMASPRLRALFRAPSLEDWHQECRRLLKGASFEDLLRTATYEGVELEPIYTPESMESAAEADNLPGFPPFIRGTRPMGYVDQPWEVAQELPFATCEEFHSALRSDLERGQTAIVLTIDQAGQAGSDPDAADPDLVGRRGTSVASLKDLDRALSDVDIGAVPVHVEPGSSVLAYAAMLVALAEMRAVPVARLRGSVGCDPIAGLLEHGALPLSLDRAYDHLAAWTAWAAVHAPQLQTVAVRTNVCHDAGASAAQDLAFMLAVGVHHLRELERRGLDIETAAPRIRCHFCIGTHFFMEIARLRAARLLWARMIEAAGGSQKAQRLAIAARTSRFFKTVLDPHVNILRATTEAMAAIFGQVDSLHVAPFDEPLGLPSEFSRRLARNTQIILREESRFDLVADPAGGSWYVEALTSKLAEAAWRRFQAMESAGGIVRAVQSGQIQDDVAETAAARRRNLALRKDVLVGTNQYPALQEKLLAPRRVDHAALSARRCDDLRRQKSIIDLAAAEAAVRRLAGRIDPHSAELFPALVEAVRAGATVGELSRACGRETDRNLLVVPLESWRAGEMFERLKLSVLAHKDEAATTVFCANLGDVTRYMPRLDFVRSFFHIGGFTVEADRWFGSPNEVGEGAMRSIAASAVIVGSDATYAAQAAETAKQLKDAGIETVILAGRPTDLVDDLRHAGVDVFIHMRTDAHAVLSELAAGKGVSL